MPRGGRRSGRPGALYPERSDLAQGVRTAPGQTYGAAKAQADAQRAIPLPQTPAPQPSAAAGQWAGPPDPGLLHAPSTRPDEPVTAGLSIGAGAGPEALVGRGASNDDVVLRLYAAYRVAPTEGLRSAIEQLERLRVSGR